MSFVVSLDISSGDLRFGVWNSDMGYPSGSTRSYTGWSINPGSIKIYLGTDRTGGKFGAVDFQNIKFTYKARLDFGTLLFHSRILFAFTKNLQLRL